MIHYYHIPPYTELWDGAVDNQWRRFPVEQPLNTAVEASVSRR